MDAHHVCLTILQVRPCGGASLDDQRGNEMEERQHHERNYERSEAIAIMERMGVKRIRIAEKFGISRGRVAQILTQRERDGGRDPRFKGQRNPFCDMRENPEKFIAAFREIEEAAIRAKAQRNG